MGRAIHGFGEAALLWLAKAVDERLVGFSLLKTDPVYQPLRDDPRLAARFHDARCARLRLEQRGEHPCRLARLHGSGDDKRGEHGR